MLEQLKAYLNDENSIEYYTDGKLIKTVAFLFLLCCFWLGLSVVSVLLFATAPVWIIPYCIYKGRKER